MPGDEPSCDAVSRIAESEPIPAELVADAGAAAPSVLRPVQSGERMRAVDVLRGTALLGILAMNIVAFAWPMAGVENPRFSGGDQPDNVAAWMINSVVFSGKMLTLFSMLFGAGLVLMSDRAAARGSSLLGVYYRRILWLLVIGLVHAYLIWSGDILVLYAVCGLVLYPFRRRSPRTLVVLGIMLLAIELALGFAFVQAARFMAAVADRVDANIAAGGQSEQWQLALHQAWNEGPRAYLRPTRDDFEKEIALYRSGYAEIVVGRAPDVLAFQTFGILMFMLWGVGGRMLLGMGLMKTGAFSAQRSWSFYRRMALFGYGAGVPLSLLGVARLLAHGYEALQVPAAAVLLTAGIVPTALGHAAAVMMICKAGIANRLTDRLAAVGRMALTNYLVQSLICTTLFYGYGAGLFGRMDRVGLWGVVIAVWAFQLIFSPIWLKHFCYGPAEWLWRSLTYWQRQPIRNRAACCGTSLPAL